MLDSGRLPHGAEPRGRHASIARRRRPFRVRRVRACQFEHHARLDLRPVDGPGRARALQGPAEAHREPPAPVADLPAEAAARAARTRLPVLDRGRELRPRVPRPPHRAAEARRLAPVLHPGLAHPRAAARPVAGRCGSCTWSRASTRSCDLPPDSFAILAKIHHAAIDVRGGAEITTLLHDTTAQPPAPGAAGALVPGVAARARSRCCRARCIHNVVQPFMFAAPLDARAAQGRRRPCSARSRAVAAPGAPADHALQFRGLAAPRVRVAALHSSTSSSASATWCRARRSTTRCWPSAAVRCAATCWRTTNCRVRAWCRSRRSRSATRTRAPTSAAGHQPAARAARHRDRGSGAAPARDPPAHVERTRRSSRPCGAKELTDITQARACRDARAVGPAAGRLVARHRPARAARELHDHQRAGARDPAVPRTARA